MSSSAARISGSKLAGSVLLAALFVLIAAPVVAVFYGSFRTDAPGTPGAAFTLANWQTAYLAPTYLQALGRTVLLALVVSAAAVAIGGGLAWIVARTDTPARGSLALLLLVPLMISNLVTTLAWIALAAPNAGFINTAVRHWTGIRTVFDIYSFAGIVLVHVLHYSSFAFLALFAALRAIDASLEEASYMVGVGRFATAWRMTLPLISPTLATSFLMIFVFVAENFSVPTLLGTPVGFQTLPAMIYQAMAVEPAQPTLAAACGTVLLWVALFGAILQRRITAHAKNYATITGKSTRPRLVHLGAWRYATLAVVLLYLLFAVVLPYLALLLGSFMSFLTANFRPSVFTLANYRALFTPDNLVPLENSLLLAGVGGFGLTLAYVLLSHALARLPRRWSGAAEFVTIIPTAIPALILGVGLIWTFVGLPLPIYGTMAILVIAYFLRNLGTGLRQANTAFGQVSAELSEAARMTGASRFGALFEIVLPIIRPAMLSLWTLLFIVIFMEVSATILLYVPATRTLSTVLWNDMGSGSQPRAFAIAVAQASLIFVILFATNRQFGALRAAISS